MLFITYWELNENVALQDTLQAANKLTSPGLFPPANIQILRWDLFIHVLVDIVRQVMHDAHLQ